MRILLYTGKGGVGKTSLSAATAIRCAQHGYRTVVLSTDAAHSLADSLATELGPVPREVAPNCWAEEINVNYELREHWGTIQNYVKKFLRTRGLSQLEADEFAVFPGMEELFSLLKLRRHQESGQFDVAIIDCAPTGSTIRMLGMPDIMRWYMDRFFDLERKFVRTFRPALERYAKVPMPTEDVYDAVASVFDRIQGMKAMLTDNARASIRLVFNPERMVIKESQRAYSYLSLFGFTVDAAVANRVIPATVKDDYFREWKKVQHRHMRLAKEIFDPLPILKAPLMNTEIVGIDRLSEVADAVFGEGDPARVYYDVPPIRIEPAGQGEYHLDIHLPGVNKGALDMVVSGAELVVDLDNYRRNILLPRALIDCELASATFVEGDTLRIRFVEREITPVGL